MPTFPGISETWKLGKECDGVQSQSAYAGKLGFRVPVVFRASTPRSAMESHLAM